MSSELVGTTALRAAGARRDRWLLPVSVLGFAATRCVLRGRDRRALSRRGAAHRGCRRRQRDPGDRRALRPGLRPDVPRVRSRCSSSPPSVAAMISILMVVLVVRHTRAEEEAGRLELVGAGVVGRRRTSRGRADHRLGRLRRPRESCTAVGLVLAGLPVAGSVAFGAGWAADRRLLRGRRRCHRPGDGRRPRGHRPGPGRRSAWRTCSAPSVTWPRSPGWTSWLSPIGWNQQVRAFAGDRWAVLLLPLVATAPSSFRRVRPAQSPGPGHRPARRATRAGGRRSICSPGASPGGCSGPPSSRGRVALGAARRASSAASLTPWPTCSTPRSVAKILDTARGSPGRSPTRSWPPRWGSIGAIVSCLRHHRDGAVAQGGDPRARRGDARRLAVTRRRWAASHWASPARGVAWLLLVAWCRGRDRARGGGRRRLRRSPG